MATKYLLALCIRHIPVTVDYWRCVRNREQQVPRQLEPVPAEFTDDDLVALFHEGHFEAVELLLERYRRFARAKARGYFLIGADFDDIEQEGMIGLFKAVRDFRPDRQSSFRAFAELCVT